MNVFIVVLYATYGAGGDILGVFENQEKAEQFVEKRVLEQDGWVKTSEMWENDGYEWKIFYRKTRSKIMKISFVMWYDETTPQIVDVLNSILLSSGPIKINLVVIKTSVGNQVEDSAVRWTPCTHVVHMPNACKREAWQKGIELVLNKFEGDHLALCDPYFIAAPRMFDNFFANPYFRFYLPYSDCYEEKKAENTFELVRENVGGSFILLSRYACWNFKELPKWLDHFCLDNYVMDKMAGYGYVGVKLSGCYIKSIRKPPLSTRLRRVLQDDLYNYEAWLKSVKGYRELMDIRASDDHCDECD